MVCLGFKERLEALSVTRRIVKILEDASAHLHGVCHMIHCASVNGARRTCFYAGLALCPVVVVLQDEQEIKEGVRTDLETSFGRMRLLTLPQCCLFRPCFPACGFTFSSTLCHFAFDIF